MSKQKKELLAYGKIELLSWLNGYGRAKDKPFNPMRSGPYNEKIRQSLSHLIKKFYGEWQKEAMVLWESSPTIERLTKGVPLKELIRDICEFGKERW